MQAPSVPGLSKLIPSLVLFKVFLVQVQNSNIAGVSFAEHLVL